MRKHWKWIITAALAAILLAAAGCAAAETVELNEANFPDAAFREYVAGRYDNDQNGVLDETELQNATNLDDTPESVLSIQGIELLTNVNILYLDNTKMTEVVIEGHPTLATIMGSGENLTRIHFSNMKELQVVSFQGCEKLTKVELSEDPMIRELMVYDASTLTELDLSTCPTLRFLGIAGTSITKIDMTMLTDLEDLWINNCHLDTLDLSLFPKLKRLGAEECSLTEIDVSGNPELTFLNVERNELNALDLRNNRKLVNVLARGNTITSLQLSSHPDMEELQLSTNGIRNIDVSSMPKLRILTLQDSLISLIDVTNNPDLQVLHVDATAISEVDLSRNPELEELRVEACKKLTKLDVSHNPKLKILLAYWINVKELDLSNNPKIEELWADGCHFSHVDLSGLEKAPDPVNIKLYNNTFLVDASDGTLDLTTLKGFDVSRASDWEGGTVSGNILTFRSQIVYYTYDCGNGIKETFALQQGGGTENGFVYVPMDDGTVKVIGCTVSGDVVIPETLGGKAVSTLGTHLFAYDQAVTSVYIPKTVVHMGDDRLDLQSYLFTECQNLKTITVDPANPAFTSRDGMLYYKDLSVLFHYPHAKTDTEYHVPAETTYIDCEAFAGFYGKLDLYLENKDTGWAEFAFAKLKDLTLHYRPGGRAEERVKSFLEKEGFTQGGYNPTFVVYGTAEEAVTWQERADEVIRDVITDGMSDREKAKALHDWITQHTKYSMKYNDQTGVLIYGEALCEGYAKTYQTLLDKAGVTNRLVTGSAGDTRNQAVGHMWNQVKIGNIWYSVDVTWDDPTNLDASEQGVLSGLERSDYFLVSSQTLAKDHYWDMSGEADTGWIPEDGGLVFRDADGQRVTGWLEIDGGSFWFDETGKNVAGKRTIDGKEYTFEKVLLFTDAAGDHYAGKKTQQQQQQEEPKEVTALKDVETAGKTAEEIREQVQQLNTEQLAEILQADGEAAEKLKEIETAAGGETRIVIAETVRAVLPAVTAAGASLNGTEGEGAAVLTIDPPKNNEKLPDGYNSETAIWFSMKLDNVKNSTSLKVPVVITAEIPAGMDPAHVMILHYPAAGAAPQQIVPAVYQSGGVWYARFSVSGFSDFAIVEKGKQAGDVNGDGKVDELDLLQLMRYMGGEQITIRTENADTDGNGVVDGRDVIHLMKYLSGEEDIAL